MSIKVKYVTSSTDHSCLICKTKINNEFLEHKEAISIFVNGRKKPEYQFTLCEKCSYELYLKLHKELHVN
jgi:hypothetical protein